MQLPSITSLASDWESASCYAVYWAQGWEIPRQLLQIRDSPRKYPSCRPVRRCSLEEEVDDGARDQELGAGLGKATTYVEEREQDSKANRAEASDMSC